MIIRNLIAMMALAAAVTAAQSSDTVEVEKKVAEIDAKVAVIEEAGLAATAAVEKLKKVKVSGYIQAQYRRGDTLGGNHEIGNFAGGGFADNSQQEFQLRRTRLKVQYKGNLSVATIQLDCSLKGVTIKDAYLKFYEPWLKSFGLQAGVFDRPFGFEIGYSSSRRESPERSRVIQTLFPKEKDLGAALLIAPDPVILPSLSIFSLSAGLFTGNGIQAESDNNQDFIGRFGVALPFTSINLALDAGASLYYGAVTARNDTAFAIDNGSWVSSLGNQGDDFQRVYYGADAQVYYDLPVIGGTSFRGEFVAGDQPSTASSSKSPSSNKAFSEVLYQRKVLGYYVMWVQNIGKYVQFVAKYDSYDPNTEIEGDDVTMDSDLSYSTLGLGLIYHWDANIKLMAYYDMVQNELSENVYDTDLTDNTFTFRIQYAF